MSNFEPSLRAARKYAREFNLTLMQQDYERAIHQASNDSERLTASSELLSHYERGVSNEGLLRFVAWLVLAGAVATAIVMVVNWGTVEIPGRLSTITETNWAVIFSALGTVGSAVIATLILLRIADAMDLLRTLSLRQAVVRLERKGVAPWEDPPVPDESE